MEITGISTCRLVKGEDLNSPEDIELQAKAKKI